MEVANEVFNNPELISKLNNQGSRMATKIKLIMKAENVSLDELANKIDMDNKLLERILDKHIYSINLGRKALRLADFRSITGALHVPDELAVNMLGMPSYVQNNPNEIGRFIRFFIPLQSRTKKEIGTRFHTTHRTVNNICLGYENTAVSLLVKITRLLSPVMDQTAPLYSIQKYLFELNKSNSEIINEYKINRTILKNLSMNYVDTISLKKYSEVMKKLGFNDQQIFCSLGMNNIPANVLVDDFGVYINKQLKAKHIYQQRLAELVGLSVQGMAYIVRTSGISIKNAVNINHILNQN
ncbi:hypothetical protein DY052_08475 [Apilactobacillus timberlakei]|uniref:hypothetical protein n=1 Tax=Apilactobacillus timberlakei TaxID=2008380 RepID=UPI001129FADB|nr:hypothetical protein [Apilactobacillus timberlakei]TPR13025.1 hypothetical protein DY052_08475 [Apilactobacillus timberlakei]